MYSIGQVSAMTNLPISTLRYYDKEGFFPNLEKQSGIRRFSQAELDANEQKLLDGEKEIRENEQKLKDAKKDLEDAKKKLSDGKKEYQDG